MSKLREAGTMMEEEKLYTPYGLITLKGIKMETNEWTELNDIIEVAEAVALEMEIEVRIPGPAQEPERWIAWTGEGWHYSTRYRARERKPAMKKVKSLCWRGDNTGALLWNTEGQPVPRDYKRFPAGDISGEVEA